MRIGSRAMLLGAVVVAPLLALACAAETQSSNPAAAKDGGAKSAGGALGQGGVAAVGADGIVPGVSGGASPRNSARSRFPLA